MRKGLIPTLILLLIALDQWVKFYVITHIKLGGYQEFIPGILSLTHLRNYGAAFSMLQNQQWFFAVVTIVIMFMAIRHLVKNWQEGLLLVSSLSLIIAGGIGNFIDRLRLGYVIDMFQTEFMDFAIFNVADACLTVGVCLLFVYIIKEEN